MGCPRSESSLRKLARVHRHNSKYGYGAILRAYCGLSPREPILGEIQHSLFLSTHHFSATHVIGPPRASGSPFVPLFSWNALLPFRHQTPIGDPLLYDPTVRELISMATPILGTRAKRVLVMPKLNDELDAPDRLSDYVDLVDLAKDLLQTKAIDISLHPRDLELAAQVQKITGLESPAPSKTLGAIERNHESMKQLANASALVSDYFGAHVFRAGAFFGVPVVINGEKAYHRAIHPAIRPLLQEFLMAERESDTRMHISELMLGVNYRRNPEELGDILTRPKLGPLRKKVLIAGYKSSRRAGVRLRQSPLWGTNPISRWWKKSIQQARWDRKFPPLDAFQSP